MLSNAARIRSIAVAKGALIAAEARYQSSGGSVAAKPASLNGLAIGWGSALACGVALAAFGGGGGRPDASEAAPTAPVDGAVVPAVAVANAPPQPQPQPQPVAVERERIPAQAPAAMAPFVAASPSSVGGARATVVPGTPTAGGGHCSHCDHKEEAGEGSDEQQQQQQQQQQHTDPSGGSLSISKEQARVLTEFSEQEMARTGTVWGVEEDGGSAARRAKDEEEGANIPAYIARHFSKELGSALDHRIALEDEAKYLLSNEDSFPVEKAVMTLAPEVPPPIKRNYPVKLVADIVCINKRMPVSGGTKFEYWPFGFHDDRGKMRVGVPGPFIRARQGDVLQVNFTNHDESGMAHSIDFHAVHGPGGGSPTNFAELQETKTGYYMLQHPGLYVYHCAAAPIPVHVHNGMFGLILVEPPEGLSPVDKEFYVMQHELYVEEDDDDENGDYILDYDAAYKEIPKHILFNGREGALVDKPMMVNADERVRLFFGNAGPNIVSSLHLIGTIFDKVYREGDLRSPPARSVQTTLVPAGGAVMVETNMQVPGSFSLIDHSIFRIDKGAVGLMKVRGTPRPDIYDSLEPPVLCPGCKTHQ